MAHLYNRRDALKLTGALLLGSGCGSVQEEYEGTPLGDAGKVVALGAETAAETGRLVLAAGGNAVDAAVTAALTAGTVHLAACGIAGYGGHMTIALADGSKVTSIDFNSAAPAAMREDTFAPGADGVVAEAHDHGWLSAGVPGTLAGMQKALDLHGTRSLRDALQPAIRLARNGFEVDEELAAKIRRAETELRKDPASVRLLFADDEPLPAGATFRNPDLAGVLETLAEVNSVDPFYRGEIARRIAGAFENNGGLVTADDLAAYHAEEVQPLRIDWRGYSIYTAPLTAGGATSLQALNSLKALGWEDETDLNRKNHARLEALRLAWRDRLTLFGDPAHVEVPLEHLLSEEYAQQSADRIRKAVGAQQPLEIDMDSGNQTGTVHISAVDREGNMVALTLTHGANFGARVTVEGLRLILGHGMSRFEPRPGHPNSPGPGKKPLHNMCPTIVLSDGRPVFALGGRGGRRIPNAVFDVLCRLAGEDRPVAEAVDAPRMHTQGNVQVSLDDRWKERRVEAIRRLGFDVARSQSARVSAVSFDLETGQTASAAR